MYRLAKEKYKNNYLFSNCIQISCPDGWIPWLDKIVDFVHEKNIETSQEIRIAQVKIKWNHLTVYLNNINTAKSEVKEIYGFIDSICSEAQNYCIVCGEELTESVQDSRLVWKCMTHYDKIQMKRNRENDDRQI
jgi:hypothetical protein